MESTEGGMTLGTETSWGQRGRSYTSEVVLTLFPESETVGPMGNGCSSYKYQRTFQLSAALL